MADEVEFSVDRCRNLERMVMLQKSSFYSVVGFLSTI